MLRWPNPCAAAPPPAPLRPIGEIGREQFRYRPKAPVARRGYSVRSQDSPAPPHRYLLVSVFRASF